VTLATFQNVFFLFFFFWVTGELSTLRQMMKVPNEPGFRTFGAMTAFWHLSHRRQGMLRAGWS